MDVITWSGVLLLPRLVSKVRFYRLVQIIDRLLEIEHGNVIVSHFTRYHPPPDLGLAHFLLFALDRPRRKAHAALVEPAWDQDGPSSCQQMVAAEVVRPPQLRDRDAVPEGERGNGIVLMVEEVERVLGRCRRVRGY